MRLTYSFVIDIQDDCRVIDILVIDILFIDILFIDIVLIDIVLIDMLFCCRVRSGQGSHWHGPLDV